MDVPVAVPVKRLVIDTRRGFAPDGPGDVDAMIRDLAARPSFDPRFGRWMLAQGKATAFLDVADTRFDDRRLAGAVVLKSITAQPRLGDLRPVVGLIGQLATKEAVSFLVSTQ